MSSKKILNQIIAVGGAVCLALAILVSPIATVPVQAAAPNNEEIMPMHAVIEWRFKIENGNLYRRLYNYRINDWVGEWEYVCPA